MYNFESMKAAKSRRFNKWHMIWVLFALNILGYAAAKFYFNAQEARTKADTETVDFKKSYGASVHGNNSLLNWGIELIQLLRGRN